MFIAGKDSRDGIYKCGIAYKLKHKSPVSYTHSLDNGVWEVEISSGSRRIIARTKNDLSYDLIQNEGFNIIQKALDILSIKNIFITALHDPASSNLGVYNENECYILFAYSLLDIPIGMECKITQLDSDGNEIKQEDPPEPIWNESFRFYRLSQSSSDQFEAYRNLFLAFESLLNSINPKKKREGEGQWLKRVLTDISKRVSLSNFSPEGSDDPVKYIIQSQYKNIRCKIQHAKFPNAQLPHSDLNPADVQHAYSELVRIWKQIAGSYFHVPTGGGVVTDTGFSLMIQKVFSDGVAILYSSDQSPPKNEDIAANPQSAPVYAFSEVKFVGDNKPGVVRVLCREDISDSDINYEKPIFRICTSLKNSLFSVAYFEEGIKVSGVDKWECIHDNRLINSTQPKSAFMT